MTRITPSANDGMYFTPTWDWPSGASRVRRSPNQRREASILLASDNHPSAKTAPKNAIAHPS